MGEKFFRVTFEIVTHSSASKGGYAKSGFLLRDGRPARKNAAPKTLNMGLREAMRLVYPQCDAGRWWQEEDGQIYARGKTDVVETRAIHPPRNITPASYARVTRLLLKNL
jgi:hypothetical protein